MESSIAVFLKRWLACELPPTEAVHGSARTPAPPHALPILRARPQPHPTTPPRSLQNPAHATNTLWPRMPARWLACCHCAANLPG